MSSVRRRSVLLDGLKSRKKDGFVRNAGKLPAGTTPAADNVAPNYRKGFPDPNSFWMHRQLICKNCFIYPRSCFQNIPQFAVGRAGWDNWMIYEARRNNWPCIDATDSINIFHQNHDYSHLPPGKKHYRLPETYENVRLAGGNLTIFNLHDVDYEYSKGNVKKVPMSWKKFWREVEIFPLIKLKQKWLANIFKTIFHPKKFYYKFRLRKQSRFDRSSDA